jgi:hypothetical protein
MIITSNKPYNVLKGMLNKQKKTGIIACNSCSNICETGGGKKLEELTERLKEDGFDVVQTDLILMPCNVEANELEFDVDEFLILACDAAVKSFKLLFPLKKVVAGLETLGLGARDAKGNIFLMKDLKNNR